MTLINITKSLKYSPLSKNNTRNKNRYDTLFDIAVATKRNTDQLELEFAQYIARIIRDRARLFVQTQKIGNRPMNVIYKPLNENYNKSKPQSSQGKFWINSGELINKLTVYTNIGHVYVGFPNFSIYKKTGVRHQKVMNWMEHGNRRIPARPLFTPIVTMISKNLDQYFNQYLKLMHYDKTLRDL